MSDRAAAFGLVLLAAALLLPGLMAGPSLDAAVFTGIAVDLRSGGTLYVDMWDHKPPGVYLLVAAAQSILPFAPPWVAVWILSLVATVLSGFAVAILLRRAGASRVSAWVGAAVCVAVAGQYLTALGGGLTEPLAVVALSGALLLSRAAGRPMPAFGTGMLIAAAVLTSIPAIAGAMAVAGFVVAESTARTRTMMLGALGALVTSAVVGMWLLANGALGAAIDAVIGYSSAYREATGGARGSLTAPVASWTALGLLFAVAPAALGVAESWRAGSISRRLGVASVAWIALSFAMFLYQVRFFAHYAIPLALPMAILAGFGFSRLGRFAARGSARRRSSPLVVPVMIALGISIVASTVSGGMEWRSVASQNRQAEALAVTIRDLTGPSDEIWVWGIAPQLYLAADRRPATPFSYLYPLVTGGFSTPALVDTTLHDLETRPPPLIVDAGSGTPGSPGFQSLLIPRPLASDGRDLDILDSLRTFVAERYVLVGVVKGWPIYRLRED